MRPAGLPLAIAVVTATACQDLTGPVPTLAIVSPAPTDTIYVGQPTELSSTREAWASADTVVWESDVEGMLAIGDKTVTFQTAGGQVLTATLFSGDTVFDKRSVAIRVRPNHAPHVELDYAWVRVTEGDSVHLLVRAVDVEDGVLPPSSIVWTTSDGERHSDTTFDFVPTPPLTVVRVTATDSHGATGSDSSVVRVFRLPSGTVGTTMLDYTPSSSYRTELLVDGPQQRVVFVDPGLYSLSFFDYTGVRQMRLNAGYGIKGLFAALGGFYLLHPAGLVRLYDLGGGLVWEWPFTGSIGDYAVAAAEAENGSLFVVARTGVDAATDTLRVARLDPYGSPLWTERWPSRGGWVAAAIGADGTMYASQARDSVEVLALNPSDGSVRWRSVTPGGELRALAVAGDGAPLLLDHATGMLTVLDPATGAVRWTAEAYASRSPVADNDNVYLLSRPSFNTTRLQARDPATGATQWSVVVDTASVESPGAMASAANGDMYVTAGYSLYRVDTGTHAVVKLYEGAAVPFAGGLTWDEAGSLAVFFQSTADVAGRLIRWAVPAGPSSGWPSLNGGGRGSRRARP